MIDKDQLLDKLFSMRDQYDNLIRLRIQEIDKSKSTPMSTKKFMKMESQLSAEMLLIKKDLGITANGEVVICNVCGDWFTTKKTEVTKNLNGLKNCEQHLGSDVIKI